MTLLNLACEKCTITGTTATLTGEYPGFNTFLAAGATNGMTVRYALQDYSDRTKAAISSEGGTAVYDATANTLTLTCTDSTNGGAPITITGLARIYGTALDDDFLTLGTGAGNAAAGNHAHAGVYEPADATILKSGNSSWIDLTDGGGTTLHTHAYEPIDSTIVRTGQTNWIDLTDGGATTLHSHAAAAETDPVFSASPAASFVLGDAAKLAGIEAGAEVNNISDVNATDLTDGGATTLHSHAADHAAVTLDVNADTLLSLSTQAIGLDTQTANTVFAGPTSGAAAVPTFRALGATDIPALSYQASDAFLTSIAGLGTAADKMIYTTAADTAAETGITADARLLLADADVPRLSTANTWTQKQTISGNLPNDFMASIYNLSGAGEGANGLLVKITDGNGSKIFDVKLGSDVSLFTIYGNGGIYGTTGAVTIPGKINVGGTAVPVKQIDITTDSGALINGINTNSPHGMTTWLPNTATFSLTNTSSGHGGQHIITATRSDAFGSVDVIPIIISGFTGKANPTAAHIVLNSAKKNGTTVQALTATEIALLVENGIPRSGLQLLKIYGDGLQLLSSYPTVNNAIYETQRIQAINQTVATGGADGFGACTNYAAESATDGTSKLLAMFAGQFKTATAATFLGKAVIGVYDYNSPTTARTGLEIEATGSGVQTTIYGSTILTTLNAVAYNDEAVFFNDDMVFL